MIDLSLSEIKLSLNKLKLLAPKPELKPKKTLEKNQNKH